VRFDLDERVFQLMYGRASPALTFAMLVFSALGSGWSIVAFLPLFASARWRRFVRALLTALVITAIVVFSLKAIVMRGRPVTVFDPLRAILLDSPTDYSFPSGHAAGSFCFALFITRVLEDARPRIRHARLFSAAAILFAAAVAVSRVVLGFHFPIDVFAGEILGGTIGAIAGARYRKAERM
jgi:undecaprenyl-diphosphatase